MNKLTKAAKNSITNDWSKHFPALAIYKPMWLLRRKGPLVSGVCLERTSANDIYTPTFHVHNLCSPVSCITLALAKPLLSRKHSTDEYIEVQFHHQKFLDSVGRFKEQNPFLLSTDITFSDVSQLFVCDIQKRLHQFPVFEFRDLAQIAAYLNLGAYSEKVIGFAAEQMKSWPERVIERIGGIGHWVNTVASSCANRDQLIRNVESEVEVHGLTDLPTYELSTGNGGVRFWD